MQSPKAGPVRTREMLPVLVQIARRYYREVPMQRVIALEMWRALAGLPKWTPRMVDAVEREIQ